MKNLLLVLFGFVLFVQCDDSLRDEGGFFVFGVYNNYCSSDCSKLYKYQDERIYEDDMNLIPNEIDLIFKETPKTISNLDEVKKLFQELPDDLLNAEKTVYGCPGCLDQDIILIEYFDGQKLDYWMIDSFTDELPVSIKDYAKRVLAILETL